MPSTDPSTAYDSPLEVRMLAGDVSGVMELVDTMNPEQRASYQPAVQRLVINRWKLHREMDSAYANRLFRAIDMARFLCSEHPLSDYWMHIGVQDIAAFKLRYQPVLPNQPIEQQLRGDNRWHYHHRIHRAVIAGLVERPQTEEYVDALFFGDLRAESNVILKHVDADPGLAPYLLQLFEREGSSEGSFSAREKYCHAPELCWSYAFITLCERGVYTRQQLLDKTLGALASDWPQFKSGWFSRFHEMLAPSVDEMVVFTERYLALCHSRIAPTVSLAVDAITQLYKAGRLDDEPLCEAMQPVIGSAVKGRVLSALDLLAQVVKKSPQRASGASAIAVHALAHAAADVQKKAIASLQAWAMDAETLELARGYKTYVAAVNHAALAELVGGGAEPQTPRATMPAAATAVVAASNKLSPFDPSRALQPLTQIPDLVERMAYVLENLDDVDEWERVAEALVRMAPIPESDHAAFLALKKRAKRIAWNTKPLGFALVRLMLCVLDGESTAMESLPLPPDGALKTDSFISWRISSLIAQASTGSGLSPLSAPTHRGGFIDPAQLAVRISAYRRAGARISASEEAFAQMRTVIAGAGADLAALPVIGQAPITFDWHVSSSKPSGGDYVFRSLHVVCDPKPHAAHGHDYGMLLCAKHMTGPRWSAEFDTSRIRFAASLQPGSLEPFFAEAARMLGNNLDWWEAQWQNRAYLDVLLEATTAMTPMACLSLGLALGGKEPGQTALAVDVLVRSVQEGRLNITAMGNVLARLWASPLVKGLRYGKSLAAAAQADVAMPEAVISLLCAMVVVKPQTPRKDLAPLLELLLELQLAYQIALPSSTRTTLAAMRLSGKSKLAMQSIVG